MFQAVSTVELVLPITLANVYLMFGLDLFVRHVTKDLTIEIVTLHIYLLFLLAIRILWKFDNNLDDFYSNFPGVGINAPTYSSPGINGYGSCLYLNASQNQSVTIYSPPFLNMAYTSFSLLAWAKPNTLRNNGGGKSDNAIFGQFQNNTKDQSLHIIVRAQKIFLGFYGDDIQGNKLLSPGNWYHVCTYTYQDHQL